MEWGGRRVGFRALRCEKGRGDWLLLALNPEERVTSHGGQVVSRSWERQENGFSPEPPGRVGRC